MCVCECVGARTPTHMHNYYNILAVTYRQIHVENKEFPLGITSEHSYAYSVFLGC